MLAPANALLRCSATALGLIALVGLSSTSAAAPAEDEAATSPEPALSPEAEADWKRAEALYRQGSARFLAADYAGAIEAFQAALELVTLHEFEHTVEFALLTNLARAHRRAYEVDKDITHLRTAVEIYRRLERTAPLETEEHDEALVAIPELEQQIAAIEAAAAEPEPDEPEPVEPAEPTEPRDRSRGLLIGGGVAIGLGAVGLGVMTLGLIQGAGAERDGEALVGTTWSQADVDAIDQRGQTGNTLAIVGGVVGGVGIAAGAALIGIGMKRKQAARSGAASVQPYGDRHGGGLVVEVKF